MDGLDREKDKMRAKGLPLEVGTTEGRLEKRKDAGSENVQVLKTKTEEDLLPN